MNKKDYKRIKKLGAEIAQLNQDVEDTMNQIRSCYIQRDVKGANNFKMTLENLLKELYKRETIREELYLLKSLKIENGYQDVLDFIKDNDFEEEDIESIIEEYCSNTLLDISNHNLYGFTYHIKENDIYITNIRWNEKQILPYDLKCLMKGEIGEIENGFLYIVKDIYFGGSVLIKDKESNYISRCSFKEAIRYLESHYYM